MAQTVANGRKRGPSTRRRRAFFLQSDFLRRPHEGFEKRRVPGMRLREHFGVPLNPENEREGGVFQGLNDAVGTLRDDVKRGGGRLHGLMVLRVDGEGLLAHDRGKERPGNDFDLVHRLAVVPFLTMRRKREPQRLGNVLDERSARDDVQDLKAPADREDRKASRSAARVSAHSASSRSGRIVPHFSDFSSP